MIQGWWMTADPVLPSIMLEEGVNLEAYQKIHRLSFDSMLMTTMLLGMFVVLCDLFTHPNLRRFILLAAATLSGALICFIGVILKLTGAPADALYLEAGGHLLERLCALPVPRQRGRVPQSRLAAHPRLHAPCLVVECLYRQAPFSGRSPRSPAAWRFS